LYAPGWGSLSSGDSHDVNFAERANSSWVIVASRCWQKKGHEHADNANDNERKMNAKTLCVATFRFSISLSLCMGAKIIAPLCQKFTLCCRKMSHD